MPRTCSDPLSSIVVQYAILYKRINITNHPTLAVAATGGLEKGMSVSIISEGMEINAYRSQSRV
jgi:hypothetical protein